MASEWRNARRWAVSVSVLVGVLVAGFIVFVGSDPQAVVQAAAHGRQTLAATVAPDASRADASEQPRSTGAEDAPVGAPTPDGTTAQRSVPGTASTGPSAGTPGTAAGRSAGAAPDGQERPAVTFVGDSWAVGVGATAERGYAVLTGEQLGWTYETLGVSGSGYTQGGGAGSTFDQRVDDAVASGADVIVVQGSLNERNSSPAALAPAALATLRRLRDAADPRTEILVVGSSYAPGTPDATIDWINRAIAGAAARVRLPFVDPAAEDWIDATDPTLWADENHPNDIGYQQIADRLERRLRSTVVR